ncbi:DUF6270 domain-containing protein [Vagococcus xieshaowenii]|uniref:Uncharacterized protein n=1 Tax=Vagococcus xieshaowenii TaxID=2562451 RepID=A0A4Z0DED9_9ENTE|nr:DUF6270 domain-containing protein [Vagococcus xieshaowenii]QCA29262.1 hypothetical protein E4Z98_07995 [Vagococcus xieshaowenii]TFZ43184.1 hypothetical protein E4031_00730 [Vagococcus xieshaowenii]
MSITISEDNIEFIFEQKMSKLIINERNILDEFLTGLIKKKYLNFAFPSNSIKIRFDRIKDLWIPGKIYDIEAELPNGQRFPVKIEERHISYLYDGLIKLQFVCYQTTRMEIYPGKIYLDIEDLEETTDPLIINIPNELASLPIYVYRRQIPIYQSLYYRLGEPPISELIPIEVVHQQWIAPVVHKQNESEKETFQYDFYTKYDNIYIRLPIKSYYKRIENTKEKMEVSVNKHSLLVAKEKMADSYILLENINVTNVDLTFFFDETTPIDKVYFCNRSMFYNENHLQKNYLKKLSASSFKINLNDISKQLVHEPQLIDFYCTIVDNNSNIKHNVRIILSDSFTESLPKINSEYLSGKFFNTKLSYLAAHLNKKKNLTGTTQMIENNSSPNNEQIVPKRVAILGSCYSRLAFSTSKYFNPDYKKYFEVVYTQFHSSIISLMSSNQLEHVDSIKQLLLSENIHPIHKNYVATDFEKSFFSELKNSNADYFLFDLYADSALSLMEIDGSYYTASYFFKEQLSSFFGNYPNMNFLTHEDIDSYLSLWYESIDRFMKKILANFSEDKIILNSIRRTYTYSDEGTIKPINHLLYGNSIEVAKLADFHIEIMEEYLYINYPKIKRIDLNSLGFIGDINHPDKLSTNHYQSEYYKTFIKQLKKITE